MDVENCFDRRSDRYIRGIARSGSSQCLSDSHHKQGDIQAKTNLLNIALIDLVPSGISKVTIAQLPTLAEIVPGFTPQSTSYK